MQPDERLPGTPPALSARADATLRFIRETMERSGSFTAVPGRGGMLMGLVALAAAAIATRQATPARWLAVWLGCAAVAAAIGVVTMRAKACASGQPLFRGPGRRFALTLAPPLLAGAILTAVFAARGLFALLPGLWLLLYGAGILTGGAASIRVVPLFGAAMMTLGLAALLAPATWGNALLAAGFGGLEIVFGAWIAWRHGG